MLDHLLYQAMIKFLLLPCDASERELCQISPLYPPALLHHPAKSICASTSLLYQDGIQPTLPRQSAVADTRRGSFVSAAAGAPVGALSHARHTLTLKGLIPIHMRPSVTRVRPCSPAQHVVPVPAPEGIVATAATQEVIAAEAENRIVAPKAIDHVIAGRPHNGLATIGANPGDHHAAKVMAW
jgi:hypothetical protein